MAKPAQHRLAYALAALALSSLIACRRDPAPPRGGDGGRPGEARGAVAQRDGASTASDAGPSPAAEATSAGAAANARPAKVPAKHRAVRTTCPRARRRFPLPPYDGVSGGNKCASDADCRDGDNGRCVVMSPRTRARGCSYDDCFADENCESGEVCLCRGAGGTRNEGSPDPPNRCVEGGCRIDSDCGASFCSPSLGQCGQRAGVVGYYCHGPDDQCTDDEDCPAAGRAATCRYDATKKRFACSASECRE